MTAPSHENRTRAIAAVSAVLLGWLLLAPSVARAANGDCSQPVSNGTAPVATDCLFILLGDSGHPGFDPVHASLGQGLGDADLVVATQFESGLLLAVAQGHVVNLDLGGEAEATGHRVQIVPRTNIPLVGFPRL